MLPAKHGADQKPSARGKMARSMVGVALRRPLLRACNPTLCLQRGAAQTDLWEFVDRKNSECLNALKREPLLNALNAATRDDEKKVLRSDTDEQLLITIRFNLPVRITHVQFTGPTDAGPKTVKMFVNPGAMDFEGADDEDGVEELDISTEDLASGAKPKRVKSVKYQKVSALVMFVSENQEDEDQTVIQSLRVFGKNPIIGGSKPSKAQQKAAAAGDWYVSFFIFLCFARLHSTFSVSPSTPIIPISVIRLNNNPLNK